MNPIRTTDRIRDALCRYRRCDNAKIIPKEEEMMRAPLLSSSAPIGRCERMEAIIDNTWLWTDERAPKLPFPIMRASGCVVDRGGWAGVVWAGSEDIRVIMEYEGEVWASAFGQMVINKCPVVAYRIRAGRLVHEIEVGGAVIAFVTDLLWQFAHPSFQPVKVAPNDSLCAARSAEWRQAREFYTVVHRRSGGGGTGIAPHRRSDVLTAHARRAHSRILKSPRWGASIGKRVWVRSCWVGPQEWQDAESKQIYRIANLTPTASPTLAPSPKGQTASHQA